jgi:uncharacterized damage-inducible protein DinB
MTTPPLPEPWLRGPVPGVEPALQPVAHALLQAREDLARAAAQLSPEELWARPGGAASVGFHLRHIAGSLDRLLAYARGASLSRTQLAALAAEGAPGDPPAEAEPLLTGAHEAIDRALAQVRATPPETLDEPRGVGRAALPSTVRGLLFHAAEHTQRHVGAVIATAKAVRAPDAARPGTAATPT